MAQGHKRATVNVSVVGSIPTKRNEVFNIFINYFALVTRQSAANRQCVDKKLINLKLILI